MFTHNELDIFPLVFPIQTQVELTIAPFDGRVQLHGEYKICIHRANAGAAREAFSAWNTTEYTVTANEKQQLRFTYTAEKESEYYIRLYQDEQLLAQLYVYALEQDLACRYPLRGDFHIHTTRSDGKEPPAVVCANYRRKGYDFIVVTDHDRYCPSLEAIDFYKDVAPRE